MSSDRARISYDERRRYRSVVTQQGRVTLEADSNEDRTIAGETLRAETLDIVGLNGTPDNGFWVEPQAAATNPPYDIEIGPGTLYVGGERVVLGDTLWYSEQEEWLDFEGDPAWVDPGGPASANAANELVYLYLEEHEVGAVEDSALFEVALGGPDSAQRTRLLQRIRRLGTDASTCADAVAAAAEAWAADGLQLDPDTQRLLSGATLEVSYKDPGSSGDLCEPDAQGGYLGADNQLIRVEIAGAGDVEDQPQLLWGYDNASFLYRVTVGADLQTLTLASVPVDDAHKPRSGQAVEVLRAAAHLETGWDSVHEVSADDFVAAATGVVEVLTSDYDSDTQQIVLPVALSAEYGDAGASPAVFLRVWEEELPFTPGTAVDLGTTGVSVTIETTGSFHVGDFWQIGVRPKTPLAVYPERYLDQPQPPDGPRLWAAPLAVVEWSNGVLSVLEDCRNPFDNLVELTKRRQSGCCDVLVQPEDVTGDGSLQKIVDSFAGIEATICLAPGAYVLDAPLRLGPQHTGITIEACHGDALISAADGAEEKFADGLIVLVRANEITLRGLRFELPRVPLGAAKIALGGKEQLALRKQVSNQLAKIFLSVGVRAVQSSLLVVEDCLFQFTTTAQQDVFAVGLFLGGECFGLTVQGNTFASDATYQASAKPRLRVTIGVLQAPTSTVAGEGGTLVQARLEDARFRDNHFSGLTVAAFLYADCGVIAFEDNTVRLTEMGFLVIAQGTIAFSNVVDGTHEAPGQAAAGFTGDVAKVLATAVADPLVLVTAYLATAYPWPEDIAAAENINVKPAEAGKTVSASSTPVWEMVERANTLFGDTGGAIPDERKLKRAELSFKLPAAQLAALADEYLELARIERAALLKAGGAAGLTLSLRAVGNEIDVRVDEVTSGPALLVWDISRETDSALVIDANRMASQSGLLGTVVGLFINHTAVAGNVIENASPKGSSIIVVPAGATGVAAYQEPGISVAGNVLVGNPLLPARSLPAPLDTWAVFNAVSV